MDVNATFPLPADAHGVVLALSGGADSCALAAVLCESGALAGVPMSAAHFDHRLRGAEAARRDLAAVRAVCARYALPLDVGAWEEPRTSEGAARVARYAFLRDVAGARGADVIATGHTADDQAETVLLHALRGAGVDGLAGMAPVAPWPFGAGLRLWRPLLSVGAADTRYVCRSRGIAWSEDETNATAAYLRNRVRALLREAPAGAALTRALLDVARAARAAADETRRRAVVALPALAETPPGGHVALPRAVVSGLPHEVAAAALRLAAERVRGSARDLARAHHDALLRAARGRTGATIELPGRLTLTVDADDIIVSRGLPAVPVIDARFEAPLPFAGVVGAWDLAVAAAPGGAAAIALPRDAVVRRRRPGDRIARAGRTRKLQDELIDRKVPRRLRDAMPVIARDGIVYWTPVCAGRADVDDARPFVVRARAIA